MNKYHGFTVEDMLDYLKKRHSKVLLEATPDHGGLWVVTLDGKVAHPEPSVFEAVSQAFAPHLQQARIDRLRSNEPTSELERRAQTAFGVDEMDSDDVPGQTLDGLADEI